MPIYEYQCSKCNKIDEVMHKVSEVPDVKSLCCNVTSVKIISSCPVRPYGIRM